jgi:hypothetical protein
MTYSKPEITLLGNADQLIHAVGKPGGFQDNVLPPDIATGDPAYDLDE